MTEAPRLPGSAARPDPGSPGGFSLAELLVALVVLEVGLLGAASVLVLSTRALVRARDRDWAVQEARALADSLAWHGVGGGGARELPFGTLEWSVSGGGPLADVRIVVRPLDDGAPLTDVTVTAPTVDAP